MLLSFALASKINRLEESRKLAEDKARRSLEQSNQTLQDSHRIKDDFFSLLSHELRTPMHGVSGIIELFSTDNLDNEQKEKLSFLNRSSIEMVSYIDNLLILSQLQSDSLTLNELPFSPEKVLQQIENRFNHEAQDQKIAFNFNHAAKDHESIANQPKATRNKQIKTPLVSKSVSNQNDMGHLKTPCFCFL